MSGPQLVTEIEEVPWREFLDTRFVWRQGEHVSLVGPTGGGKTTLALEILERRRLVCVFANKPRDKTMDQLVKRSGWKKIERFDPKDQRPGRDERVVLWPKAADLHSFERVQGEVYRDALQKIWRIGYWCIFFDEVRYICQNLKLDRVVQLYWQQARALGVSVVACTQRPAHVPVMMFDQATHLFFWCDNDDYNLKRIGGLGAINSKLVREAVSSLPPHTVLYLNTRTGDLVQTKVELTGKVTK